MKMPNLRPRDGSGIRVLLFQETCNSNRKQLELSDQMKTSFVLEWKWSL